MKFSWAFAIGFLLILGTAHSAPAEEEEVYARVGGVNVLGDAPSSLNLALGSFDMFDDDDSVTGLLEWRFGRKLGFAGPLTGMVANNDGALFGYVGLYADFSVGKLLISPHTGFGAYERGKSEDLGGVFEFFSSLTVARRLENLSEIGIRLGHISNADLHDRNPGTDLLLLQYRIPF